MLAARLSSFCEYLKENRLTCICESAYFILEHEIMAIISMPKLIIKDKT